MIHVVAMKCLIGLPLLIHVELLWKSRSRSFKDWGVGVWVRFGHFKNWGVGVGVRAFAYRLHSSAWKYYTWHTLMLSTTGWSSHAGKQTWLYDMPLLSLMSLMLLLLEKLCLKYFHFCRLYAVVLCSHVVPWPCSSSVKSCVAVVPASPVSCDSIWLHKPDQT
jgi:hypothetical protein